MKEVLLINTVNFQIERIQNPALYKQYVIRKTEMEKANPTVQNERTLWHGTSQDTLPSINDTGFNRSYCGKNGKRCIIHLLYQYISSWNDDSIACTPFTATFK